MLLCSVCVSRPPRLCCRRAEPVAFRALVAAASQGERQLKDTLVSLLLALRNPAARDPGGEQSAAPPARAQSQQQQQIKTQDGRGVAESAYEEAAIKGFVNLDSAEDVEDED